jgi:hypothetical protein
MRLVTWNCNGAFRRKYQHLDALNADILVIQECEDPAQSTADYRAWARNYVLTGYGSQRGSNGELDSGLRPETGVDGQDLDEADCLAGPEDQTGEEQEYQRRLRGNRQKGDEQEDGQDFAQGRISHKKMPPGRSPGAYHSFKKFVTSKNETLKQLTI